MPISTWLCWDARLPLSYSSLRLSFDWNRAIPYSKCGLDAPLLYSQATR